MISTQQDIEGLQVWARNPSTLFADSFDEVRTLSYEANPRGYIASPQ
jgi:hypothetical protein